MKKVSIKNRDGLRRVSTTASTVTQLLAQLGISGEEFLVARNGTLAVGTEKIKNKDTLILYPVVSGG